MGSTWTANFLVALIFPYFLGARFGEYLVCQLVVGPHIPLFLRCQVWGVRGLPTFRWTSYSLICEVPGLGSTWSAYFSLDLIFPYFWGAMFGECLVCQLFVGPHIPLFLRCQVWGVPGLPTLVNESWNVCRNILQQIVTIRFHWVVGRLFFNTFSFKPVSSYTISNTNSYSSLRLRRTRILS